MHIERLQDSSAEIDAFLLTHNAEVHQSASWAELQGGQSWRIVLRSDDGDLLSFAQIFQKKLPLGMSWLHVPRGPIGEVSALLLAEIEKLGRETGTILIRFDWAEGSQVDMKDTQLKPAHATQFPETTLLLDLTQSEDELLVQMKPKGRYNIRVAEKHGVTVREARDPAAADIFFELLKKTTARDGFAGHEQAYYRQFLETLGEHASCFIAEHDGQPIAASLVTYFADRATYYYGASDHAFRHMMAPYLVQWQAIQAAKVQGYKKYDFLGIAPEDAEGHELAGVTSFKKKFGGTVVEYPKSSELILQPTKYFLLKLYKKLRSLT